MGCFSFLDKSSDAPVLSSSFDGSAVHLFLLEDGKVIEEMYGNYDSYGRVFKNSKDEDDKSMTENSSFEWELPWSEVCDLMFTNNKGSGIAAVFAEFYTGTPPTTKSEDDPDQGWGSHENIFADDVAYTIAKTVEKPYHKVHK